MFNLKMFISRTIPVDCQPIYCGARPVPSKAESESGKENAPDGF